MALASTDVISGTISLSVGDEPSDDGNTNNTLDLGFIPQIDLGVMKELNAAESYRVPSGTAVFDIIIENHGPMPATEVTFRDPDFESRIDRDRAV